MNIELVAGVGTGPTKLAAFDAALREAGIANHNLIRLSSVIPGGSQLKQVSGEDIQIFGEWGDRLYAVWAESRVVIPNEEAWAGIGWVQDPVTGEGLFVEHDGASEATVRHDITDSLNAMMKGRGVKLSDINMKVIGATCENEPVCALVAAVYKAVPWSDAPNQTDARTIRFWGSKAKKAE